jgi:alpha-tubulin suppressor-like RCC1 family protein
MGESKGVRGMSISRIVAASWLLLVASAGVATAGEQDAGRVAAGGYHMMAVRPDGSLWTWGRNYAGQLGIEWKDPASDQPGVRVPVRVGKDNDWVAVAAGDHHSIAMKRDGALWAWGYNAFGQLGDGSADDAHSPVLVQGGNDWAAFAAGDYHTIARKRDGSIWTWGLNKRGQLGLGATPVKDKPRPFRVGDDKWLVIQAGSVAHVLRDAYVPTRVGTDNDWTAVAAGGYFSAALKRDGSLWMWGDNRYGQIGIGTQDHQFTPARVGEDDDWAAVYPGMGHVLAVKRDGTLWAWGLNDRHQIALATDAREARTPLPVETPGDWACMSGAWRHTLALKRGGTLWAFGLNNYGQLGNGDTKEIPGVRVVKGDHHVGDYGDQVANASPTPFEVGGDDWVAISARGHHSIGMKRDGSIWTWGLNWFGQLGIGSTQNQPSPVRVVIDRE